MCLYSIFPGGMMARCRSFAAGRISLRTMEPVGLHRELSLTRGGQFCPAWGQPDRHDGELVFTGVTADLQFPRATACDRAPIIPAKAVHVSRFAANEIEQRPRTVVCPDLSDRS